VILVDTSVWIEFFNGIDSVAARLLGHFIETAEEVFISDYILAEVLQGFRKDEDFELARKHLLQFPVYSLKGIHSYIRAAQIYRRCRREGVTIRKTADCIIAQTAIENKLALLHHDADFDRIASVVPLKIYQTQ
jgi:predicted nucleic acid-binding protein